MKIEIKLTNSQIKSIFSIMYKSNNIVTPEIVGYGQEGNYLYQLSKGGDITGKINYGITVLEITKLGSQITKDCKFSIEVQYRDDLGRLSNNSSIKQYIKYLKNKV